MNSWCYLAIIVQTIIMHNVQTIVMSKNIGKPYIWWFAQKCCWGDFKLADLISAWRKTHACSINGLIMV